MTKVWQERQQAPEEYLQEFSGYDEVIARLLYTRGVTTPQEAASFLEPKYEDTNDPFKLLGMEKAVARISEAVSRDEKITVYADYDADAVTATAVVLRFFREIGYQKADYYIPDRFSEGYGMNEEAIKDLASRGTKLIITVDTGTNALEPIQTANSIGVDVIITDHHQVNDQLPSALAVVNPHQEGDEYPFKNLTGVGVAFKLVQALTQDSRFELKEGWEKWLLDLVAIGTVADFQSLLGENRILVKWGMHVLQKSKWLGLRRLMEVAEINQKSISAYTIGFQIAPRINAPGRIDHASKALELLMADDERKASELAHELNELNAKRQNLTDQILSEAREQVQSQHGKKIRFAYDKGWPKGILGLVAGRLSTEFNRPVLTMSIDDGEATGSARSIKGFSIVKAMQDTKDIFTKYGGHDQAAGFSLPEENLEKLKKTLLEYAERELPDELLDPVLYYDAELLVPALSDKFVDTLEQFEPVGAENPKPLFRMNKLIPQYPSKIGADGKHLRLYVGEGDKSFGCIGFGLGYWADKLLEDQRAIDIVCEPQYNEWKGQKKIQLKINDIKFSGE